MRRGRPTDDPKTARLKGKKPSAAALAASKVKHPGMEPGAPKMPSRMSRDAKAHWVEIVPILLELGTLTPADGSRLEMMCTSWYRWHQYESYIDEHGPLFVGEKGIQSNPAVEMARRMEQRYTELSRSFGLDPLSRQKLEIRHTEEPEKPDPKATKPHQVDESLLDD